MLGLEKETTRILSAQAIVVITLVHLQLLMKLSNVASDARQEALTFRRGERLNCFSTTIKLLL
jgi:hypothetical protein